MRLLVLSWLATSAPPPLRLRKIFFCQHLAEFDTHLTERVDVPDDPQKNLVPVGRTSVRRASWVELAVQKSCCGAVALKGFEAANRSRSTRQVSPDFGTGLPQRCVPASAPESEKFDSKIRVVLGCGVCAAARKSQGISWCPAMSWQRRWPFCTGLAPDSRCSTPLSPFTVVFAV